MDYAEWAKGNALPGYDDGRLCSIAHENRSRIRKPRPSRRSFVRMQRSNEYHRRPSADRYRASTQSRRRACGIPAAARTAPCARRRAAVRMRRLVRLPPVADGRRVAGDRSRRFSAFSKHVTQCGCPSSRAAPAPGCPAARCRPAMACCSPSRASCHPRYRSGRAHRARAARRAQSRDIGSGGAVRPLLRAGSVEPDRVLDRRQRRREFRRRALPQVRADGAQYSAGARVYHRGRAARDRQRRRSMRRVTTCWR